MNAFDNKLVDQQSFSWRDLIGQDVWATFSPVFGSLTIVGTPSYSGRMRVLGRSLSFQVKFSAGTSIASVAGTDYLTLPVTARGSTGLAVMTNDTSNIAIGTCHLDVATSRCYLPTQLASGNVFNLFGTYEI